MDYDYGQVKCAHSVCVLTFHYMCLWNPWVPDSRVFPSTAEEPCKKKTQPSCRDVKWASDITDVSSSIQRDWKTSAVVWRYTLTASREGIYFTLIFRNTWFSLQSPRIKKKNCMHSIMQVIELYLVSWEYHRSVRSQYFWVFNLGPSWTILILKVILQVSYI